MRLFIVLFFIVIITEIMSAQLELERSRKLSQLFFNTVSDHAQLDLVMAKRILNQFKDGDSLLGNVADSTPILHHLLNLFRLSNNERSKAELIEVMLLCIQRGADSSMPHKNDPPLLFKLILMKELHVAKEAIASSPKAVTELLMGSPRWSSSFFASLYSIPSESVPLVKLLLYADTIVRTKGLSTMGGLEGLKKLLSGAVLGKPTVRPADLDRHSGSYAAVVAALGGEQGQLRLADMIRCLDETAAAVHRVLLDAVLGQESAEARNALALQFVRVLTAAPVDPTQLQSPYSYTMGRNALHYLGLSGSTVLVQQLLEFLQALQTSQDQQQIVTSDGRPSPSAAASSVSAVHEACVGLLRDALTAVDERGHTPISYAAMRFSQRSPAFEALRALCAAVGVSVEAALRDATDAGVLRSLSSASRGDSSTAQAPQSMESGGWSSSGLPGFTAPAVDGAAAAVEEVFAATLPSNREFFQKYLNTGTPVVFRQAIAPSPPAQRSSSTAALRSAFQKDTFLRRYGNITVPASVIPYAGTFGVQQLTSTMSAVANSASKAGSGSSGSSNSNSAPLYTFCTPAPQWSGLLQNDVPVPRCIARHPDEGEGEGEDCGVGAIDPATASWSFEVQFYLGAAGTGAPVHFHGHAINSLAYGEKHWLLYPPSEAFYSTTPARKLFETQQQGQGLGVGQQPIRVVQRAGDVLFVPALWGHATLNTMQSIGVAHEFSVESFCME